jgi:hypothetical protein
MAVRYHLDRVLKLFDYLRIDGWVFSPTDSLERVEVWIDGRRVHTEREAIGLPTPSVQLHPSCGFSVSCLVKDVARLPPGQVKLIMKSGEHATAELEPKLERAPLDRRFEAMLRESGPRPRLLEVGGRIRTPGSEKRRDLFAFTDYLAGTSKPGRTWIRWSMRTP